jgi:cell division protein FtsA
MLMNDDQIFVGLDIGTTKIAAVVARMDEYNMLNIAGVGTSPSNGLRRGVVINIEKTVSSIRKALEQAQLMSGCDIQNLYAGIAGDHIRSINSKGVIAVGSKDKIITKNDVERVVDAAKAIALPMDREIIHILPQEFIVDDQDGIKNPIGMAGTRLECEVHIVTASTAAVQNIANCVRQAGYDVDEIVLEPYASSLAVLDEDELDLGVAIMDIGGGTTDIAVFFDGGIRFTSVLGLGGEHVTNDLSHGLRTPMDQAEEIKKKYGCALQSMVDDDDLVMVPGIHGRSPREIARNVLCAIIEPRMEEIFNLALRELEKSDVYDSLGAGIVLTGGASLLPGSVELAERVLGLPVKIGTPTVSGGLVETVKSPIYATGVGLIQYALKRSAEDKKVHKTNKLRSLINKIKDQFEDLF